MFAYCGNNPVNLLDESGHAAGRINIVAINDGSGGSTVPSEYYSSIREAVRAFGREYFYAAMYTQREYGTYIYSVMMNGRPYYYYESADIGDAKKVALSILPGKGSDRVASVHIHVLLEVQSLHFSRRDIEEALATEAQEEIKRFYAYLVCPDKVVLVYNPKTNMISSSGTIYSAEVTPGRPGLQNIVSYFN